jgi:hypothetical protein
LFLIGRFLKSFSSETAYSLGKSYLSFNRGEDFFFKSTNQKQELPVVAMLFNRTGQNEQSL